ncbi:MFS transporter [Francisella tularensis subsp. novicida]|uniref:MFS transporter n=2 Tax=Francisella tularensis TaxID=263 RepID=A0A6I4RVY8_FRATU|nr:MFS transporter [Francisella tularensis]ABK89104.1 major facilitator superfamily (MFS) transport protein [Francisella tularensis subsp. novicida U112]AJI60767.1 sugar (and other) transporter family protein [Francisella tularensis subsp. novicida U112]MBK2036160.1 MFS transporter [Francisella tularensis subsp. novicida]MBK2116086.1 MFS transporter [Francisella tularensis subsp. novicida]MBK2311757.1 MFS transporter [Francisella tularensis subsp. novicida]
MYNNEVKTTINISLIYSFRMIGLFIIFPIFSLYINHLEYATPFLIGLALGVYGLSQAMLQIVLSILSDKFGRKPIIFVGLIFFIIGSIVAACSSSIYGIIIGRAIQGAGAIGSTLTALVADSTKEENRLKAMSLIGMSIGFSFLVAMMFSSILNSIIGLSGIFWLTAVFGGISIFMLTKIPTPKAPSFHHEAKPVFKLIKDVISHKELLKLNYGIFTLHATLTALFIVIPPILTNILNINADYQWLVYLPVLIISFSIMFPFVMIAEVQRKMKKYFVIAVALLGICLALLVISYRHTFLLSIILTFFFAAFTFLESCLPSWVSKIAPIGSKGTAMGVFSSCQFFGIFIGGMIGGITYHHFGIAGVLILCTALSASWLIISLIMAEPTYLNSKVYRLDKLTPNLKVKLDQLLHKQKGIYESIICLEENAIYIKVDKKEFDEKNLLEKINFITANQA